VLTEIRDKHVIATPESKMDEFKLAHLSYFKKLKDGSWIAMDCAPVREFMDIPWGPSVRIKLDLEKSPLDKDQTEDMNKLLPLKSAFNLNDMGLGKTAESVLMCQYRECKKILIVCPKSVMSHWKGEFLKWWPEKEHNFKMFPSIREDDVICIINYDKLTLKSIEKFKSFRWDAVILDESHNIMNHKTQRFQSCLRIPSDYKLLLTGTPILNKPGNLWSQLYWLDPFYAGPSYWDFAEAFCEIDTRFGKSVKGLTKVIYNQMILQNILDKISVRRLKSKDGKSEPQEIWLDMYPEQEKLYKNTLDLVFEELPKEMDITNGMTHLLRLQQVTSNPGMYGLKNNPKFEFLKDYLDTYPDKKIIVFSKFSSTIDALMEFMGEKPCVKFTGDMDERERDRALFTFSQVGVRMIAGTIGAMGQGVDGLQYSSSTVFFIDRDWSPALNSQAEDRAYRRGQTEFVNVYRLCCLKSIDHKVGEMVFRKESDIRRILDEDISFGSR
jgi:SNF2 family DNA or RNA helicase